VRGFSSRFAPAFCHCSSWRLDGGIGTQIRIAFSPFATT